MLIIFTPTAASDVHEVLVVEIFYYYGLSMDPNCTTTALNWTTTATQSDYYC